MNSIQKPLEQKIKRELNKQTSKNFDHKNITETEKKNRKLEEKLYQKYKKKKLRNQRLRNLPRTDYKTFFSQSKILNKVEYQKPF